MKGENNKTGNYNGISYAEANKTVGCVGNNKEEVLRRAENWIKKNQENILDIYLEETEGYWI
jgi:hypothetical protein